MATCRIWLYLRASLTFLRPAYIKFSSAIPPDILRHTEISAGILYCDITDHLPWFITLICSNLHTTKDCMLDYMERKIPPSFPVVRLSRKRAKDKPWITKGIQISIKVKHRLYKLSLRNSKAKLTRYKNLLRTCIMNSESLCYRELFENTKTSAYNLWNHLGPIINNKTKSVAV